LSFVSRFKEDGALVLLRNNPGLLEAEQNKLVSHLEQLAARMRMDFMCISPNDSNAITEILPGTAVNSDLRP
jgi:hypothetical protein